MTPEELAQLGTLIGRLRLNDEMHPAPFKGCVSIEFDEVRLILKYFAEYC